MIMKNVFKFLLAFALVFSLNSCKDSNNAIDEVLNYGTGAALRTIAVNNAVLNSSDASSEFSVEVEEQDAQNGGLFKALHVYVSIQDLTPDNGTTVADDVFVKTIDASAFSPGPHGLPRGIVTTTFGETSSAMGLTSSDYYAGDVFIIELRVELTDGRIFGAAQAGASITGGFFDSPYQYNSLLTCAPEPGDYQVDMQDSYGDGWQGDGIRVDNNGTIEYVTLPDWWATNEGPYSAGSATVSVAAGSNTLTWEFTGDSYPAEVSFQIYDPYGGLLGDFSEPAPGLLPVTFCLIED
jgi:hypothetical protein